MITADKLLEYDLDPIPKYLLLRDVMKLSVDSKELLDAKDRMMTTKWVNNVVQQQWEDGSWGQFHSMSELSQTSMTTEQAIRRLLILGLDHNDPPIKNVVRYMEKYLVGEVDLRDRKEKKHDWLMLTRLFVATWLRIIDPSNPLALEIAKDWAQVVSHAFSGDVYDPKAYKEAFYDRLKVDKKKYMWKFTNFYLVALLPGLLSSDIESKFLDYILDYETGIYYIYDKPLNRLPNDFCSKQASRYIHAYELISSYDSTKTKTSNFKNWILANQLEDGFWDMGQISKDNMQFPLSNSWRKAINRRIDCTIRLQKLLLKL